MKLSSAKTILCLLGLATLYLVGVGTRRAVLETQLQRHGADLPFTLESALHFRRIRLLVEGKGLPTVDHSIFYPEGVRTHSTYSMGTEYLYAGLAKCMPETMPLEARVRWIEVCLFGLGIPFVALWIWWWLRSASGAAIGALYYATGLASVIRSTGQELSRENTALPLLALHLALLALARGSGSQRTTRLAAWGAAVALGLALMSWDLIQFYLLLWGILLAVYAARGRDHKGLLSSALPSVAVVTACAFLNPYLRAHGFWCSPVLLLLWGASLTPYVARRQDRTGEGHRWWRLAVTLAPALLALLLLGPLRDHYGHFGQLLWAKLAYLNQKPPDPAALSYAARIMWVPALHSADWALTRTLFPASLPLTVVAAGCMMLWPGRLKTPYLFQLALFTFASLLAFGLFVRFHVFLALFSAGTLGAWMAWAQCGRRRARWVVMALLLTGVSVESAQVLSHREQWGRANVYYKETSELIGKLRSLDNPKPVLAGFGLSGSILAYADYPVVLHPKFESAGIRDRVRAYGEVLFGDSEQALRDWADQFGVGYYVCSKGQFAKAAPHYQMRYFVDLLDPGPDVAARLLEDRPRDSRYFEELWSNRKYRLYRMLTRDNERRAHETTGQGVTAFEAGDLAQAEQYALSALELDPRLEEALTLLGHVMSLREQGFSYDPIEAGTLE